MSLHTPTPDAPIRPALTDGLANFADANDPVTIALSHAPSHRIFTLTLADVKAGGPGLENAKRSGWRFLAGEVGQAAAAEVSESTGGQTPKVRNLTRGPQPVQAWGAVRQAQALPETKQSDYEMRVLRIPGLLIEALWLKQMGGAEDLFIPYLVPERQSDSQKVWPRDAFLKEVQTLAGDKLDFDDSPRVKK